MNASPLWLLKIKEVARLGLLALFGILLASKIYQLATKVVSPVVMAAAAPAPSTPPCDVPKLKKNLTSDETFIDYLYCFVLERPSDAGGRATWAHRLKKNPSRAELFLIFATTSEFNNTKYGAQNVRDLSDKDFIPFAYERFLFRAPTAAERRAWEKRQAAGNFDKKGMLKALFALPELRRLHSS